MGLFNRHKHTLKLVSTSDEIKQAVWLNGVLLHQEERYTVVLEQCTDCGKLVQHVYDGHHAHGIAERFKTI